MSTRLGCEVYLKLEVRTYLYITCFPRLIQVTQDLQLSQAFKYRGISPSVSQAVKEYGPGVHILAASSGAGTALAWVGKVHSKPGSLPV
jgi:hypothetical protein